MKKFILSFFLSIIYIFAAARATPSVIPTERSEWSVSLLGHTDRAVPLLCHSGRAVGEDRISILPTAALLTASAAVAGGYACILTDDVYLYASTNERSGLFLLPRTYFVKTLDIQSEFTKVEYAADGENSKKLTGYCKTEQLTFVDYTPVQPYFHTTFDVTYRLENGNSNYPFLTEITVTCAYYGEYPIGSEIYCYVLRDGAFGYVPKPTDLTVPQNTEYSDRLTATEPPEPTITEEEESLPPTQIVTIVLLCLLAPILASLILRPSRKSLPYDEE